MEYRWSLEELARLVAHKHYLEDTLEEVIEQKNIALDWLREKFHAIGPIQVFRDNHIRYINDEGEECTFYWNVTTRNGQEFEQFITPLKRYAWFEGEWRRTEEKITAWQEKINNNDE